MASDGDCVACGRCATRCGGLACKIGTESKVGPPQRQSADSRPAVRPEKAAGLDFRILFIAGVIVLSMALIGVRLWYVQVVLADYYRHRIRGSSEVTVRMPSVRGEIRDRNGIPLVTNRPSYEIDFYFPDIVNGYKEKYGQVPMTEARTRDNHGMLHDRNQPDIVEIVDRAIVPKLRAFKLSGSFNPEKLRSHFQNDYLVPFAYRQDLDFATFSKFAEKDFGVPGVQMNVTPVRQYTYGALGSQILGYVGAQKDISHLPDIKDFDFYQPDVQGRTNIEYTMDDVLRGKPGKRILTKNAKGQLEGVKEVVQPIPGANVYLSIDARIQYIVEKTLRFVGRAACVVVDPNNGEVLAMASVPSFDPNKFIPSISARDWRTIKNAEADPLTNRATGAYAPGSTYKIITALAGLTRNLAKARFTCSGGVSYGNTYMHCWGVHGNQDLVEAIRHSCDAYFYQFGNAAGIDAIDRVGKTLGLGQATGIELTDEDPGLLPSPEWLQTTKSERWTQGQTANASIGQGYVLASPLQMAMVAATVANGGVYYQPTLIHQIQQSDTTIIRRPTNIRGDLIRDNKLTKEQIELVRKGMWEVVNAPDGTGKQGAVPGVQVAGKTGTAQFWRNGKKDNHTWFLAFTPYDHPKIALAVMIEGGKSGGGVAAPMAAEIIKQVLALDNGYDPSLKRLDPAIGNYKLVDSVSFPKNGDAQVASTDEVGPDNSEPSDTEQNPKKLAQTRQAEPDIRPDPDNGRTSRNPLRGFFNLFKSKPKQATGTQPADDKKKHHFLFF
jgi:penicillin-binding protein 2